MLHRQLQSALEEIFGLDYVDDALRRSAEAQQTIHQQPDIFKQTILGFQRLNYREEQSEYAEKLDREFGIALICSLLDNPTRQLIVDLGLNYI